MALPLEGPITLGMVAAELGLELPLQLGDARVRALAGKPEGPISLGDLRGKSAYAPPTVVCDPVADGWVMAFDGENKTVSASPSFVIHGGEAPFTVSWARISGDTSMTVSSSSPWTFSTFGPSPFNREAVYRATVTDARSNEVMSDPITVTLRAGPLE